jgi:hypothetical protein
MLRELMGVFGLILSQIEQHDTVFPEHGKNCHCMDAFIRQLRQATESETAQERVDYVLAAVVKNRPVKMIAQNGAVRAIGRGRG